MNERKYNRKQRMREYAENGLKYGAIAGFFIGSVAGCSYGLAHTGNGFFEALHNINKGNMFTPEFWYTVAGTVGGPILGAAGGGSIGSLCALIRNTKDRISERIFKK